MLRMTILVPNRGQLASVRSQVSAAWLDQAAAGMASTDLAVSLPKLKPSVGAFSLTEGLQALGMTTPFTRAADLFGVFSGHAAALSKLAQKAFIAVDETGTDAASASVMPFEVSDAGEPTPQPVPFVVDRPFRFFIRDATSGTPTLILRPIRWTPDSWPTLDTPLWQ
jgi:serpin B